MSENNKYSPICDTYETKPCATGYLNNDSIELNLDSRPLDVIKLDQKFNDYCLEDGVNSEQKIKEMKQNFINFKEGRYTTLDRDGYQVVLEYTVEEQKTWKQKQKIKLFRTPQEAFDWVGAYNEDLKIKEILNTVCIDYKIVLYPRDFLKEVKRSQPQPC